MDDIIEIKNLTRDFGSGRGIFDVNFSVHKGECFGYLGPNGAGKSTTIRILMGFSKQDEGLALINGRSTFYDRNEVMEGVSYIPGEISLPPLLTGKQVLDIQKELKGLKDTNYLNELINMFQLDTNLLCKDMSLGMRRKLVIVSAFMNDPDVIIMDEPSSGLDPEMQDVFVELIKKEKERGKTILLSSHIFSEIDSCCDRIAVIKDGVIVSLFNSSDLKHKTLKTYEIIFNKKEEYLSFTKAKNKPYKILEKSLVSKRVLFTIEDKQVNKMITKLSEMDLKDFKEKKETLEDYFMSFYKEDRTYTSM